MTSENGAQEELKLTVWLAAAIKTVQPWLTNEQVATEAYLLYKAVHKKTVYGDSSDAVGM